MGYLDHPVFICGHRKSGTTMLINLLDGASELVVYPDDSGFFYLYYPRYDGPDHTDQEKLERMATVLVEQNLATIINDTSCDARTKEMLLAKIPAFREGMLSCPLKDITTRDMLQVFIEEFRKMYYPEHSAPRGWVEKTTSSEIYALDMAALFPEAKFIHLIRDPRDNWASLRSGWSARYQRFNDELNRLKQSMIERGRLGMDMAMSNEQALGKERYKVIRFEDLVVDSRPVMRELATFLGIGFSPSLLQTTVLGQTWEGNNFDGLKFNGPSSTNVGRWKQRLEDPEEAMLMEFHFRESMETFGYEPAFSVADTVRAAAKHYKWFNFATRFSAK